MKRWLVTIAIAVVCVARAAADVTITTTTTLEGKIAAIAGGNVVPKVITRIKGNKSRTDVDMGAMSITTLVDLTTKEAFLLNHAQKTAQLLDPKLAAPKPGMPMPKITTQVKPTGQKRAINNEQCEEFAVDMTMDMSPMASADTAQNASAALKDMRMSITGSVWSARSAPGSAEYLTFQSTAAKFVSAALTGGKTGSMPGGLEQAITGFAEAPGIPYLIELTMGIEGTGPMVDVMKQMGPMKIVSRVTSVTTDAIADTIFAVPEDYKTIKTPAPVK